MLDIPFNYFFNFLGFMKLAMREPLFVEFADVCLQSINPEGHKKSQPTDEEIVQHISDVIEEGQEN
jgi:hypothetical protein